VYTGTYVYFRQQAVKHRCTHTRGRQLPIDEESSRRLLVTPGTGTCVEPTAAVRAGAGASLCNRVRPAPCDKHLDGDVQVGRPPSDPSL
jgi:hypothetical protein